MSEKYYFDHPQFEVGLDHKNVMYQSQNSYQLREPDFKYT